MIDCPNGDLRDVLPEYLHARLEPRARAAVAAHLATCELCSEELELLRAACDAHGAMPPMDIARIVAALPSPPKRPVAVRALPARGHRAARWPVAVAAAAAAAALLAAGLFDAGQRATGAAERLAGASGLPSPEQPAITPKAEEAPSLAVVEPEALPELTFAGGVSDLSAGDLEELIAELDAIEALPAIEPQPVLLSLPAAVSGDD